jgi:hypothetical protein
MMIIALLLLILFGILFPKALRFLFALMFIGVVVILGEVHAETDNSCNPHSIIANGFFTHGSMICNSKWLDRPASIAMVILSKRCSGLSEDSFFSLAMQGGKDFDNSVTQLGRTIACKKLDKEMTNIDNAR